MHVHFPISVGVIFSFDYMVILFFELLFRIREMLNKQSYPDLQSPDLPFSQFTVPLSFRPKCTVNRGMTVYGSFGHVFISALRG